MNTIDMLHAIESAKCIYNIHYCNAGVGIVFYYPEENNGNWRNGLSVAKYYLSFEQCIEEEYKNLLLETK